MREAKPFWKSSHQCFYVKVNGKQTRLDPDEKRAHEIWHELKAGTRELGPDAKLIEVISEFLAYAKKYNAESTWDWYRRHLKSFHTYIGPVKVQQLKPLHVERWVEATYQTTNPNTLNNVMRPIVRCLNWAAKSGRITSSPLAGMVKPRPTSRDVDLTEDQYDRLLAAIKDQPLLDVVSTMWHTGCRPTEVRRVTAAEVGDRCWQWPLNAPGKFAGRVVLLNDHAWALTQRLAAANPTGPLYRNRRKNGWTKDALCTRLNRLGVQLGFRLVPGSLRIGFATNAIVAGVDLISLSELMGHSDLRMLKQVYAKINKRSDHLRKVLEHVTVAVSPARHALGRNTIPDQPLPAR